MNKKSDSLRQWTKARVALGHTGNAIPIKEILIFNQARALARDAVHATWDINSLQATLTQQSEQSIIVHSRVASRMEYLQRPDLGRQLDEQSHAILKSQPLNTDIVFIISDGLSATAIDTHFLPLWSTLQKHISSTSLNFAPLVLAPFARVALSDAIGFDLQAKLAVIFIGERPGLSASDSLGIYLTYAPKPGNTDAARNCISNIRPPDGLSYEHAAKKLLYLIQESLHRKLSGISLKEESGKYLE